LAYDIACELNGCGRAALAAKYFELLRNLPGDPDTTVLLQLGRCYLACGEQATAEECFLAAIEADENTIEPRIELANMYESMNDNEAALVLAAEAIALRSMAPQSDMMDAEGQDPMQQLSGSIASQAKTHGNVRRRDKDSGTSRREGGQRRPAIPRRYRPKKLAAPDKRQQDEKAHAIKLSRQYETVRDLKQRIRAGDSNLILAWMQSSQELVDEFRYLKKFYTWDKYLHFLRSSETSRKSAPDQPENELLLMYERLSRSELRLSLQHGIYINIGDSRCCSTTESTRL
jgi:general transcription factor 3C polypeptide 3 (transcription factor C subunit 4)